MRRHAIVTAAAVHRSHAADELLARGFDVLVVDELDGRGVERPEHWVVSRRRRRDSTSVACPRPPDEHPELETRLARGGDRSRPRW